MRLIDIVIPAFNQPEFTTACLRSLGQEIPDAIRVILINNGSTWEAREQYYSVLRGAPYSFLMIDLPVNTGFVRATNVGIAISEAPYLMLLNNDTEMTPGVLGKLLEVLYQESSVGIVGPRSSSLHQWQGQAPEGQGWTILGDHQMLSFFCALMRRDIVPKCGYLSEQYKAGLGDDDDYCEVVKAAGWKLALRSDALVLHHHRTTFREVYGEDALQEMQRANIMHFRRKWKR